MKRVSRILAVAALLGAFVVVALVSCSDDNKTTNPTLELNSGDIGNGQTFSHTFPSTPASYPYHCTIHSAMLGTVIVEAGASADTTVRIENSTSSGFSPSTIKVAPSGRVTWNNVSGATHTVTSR